MKLFYSPNSPYARKCRVIVLEKKLTGHVSEIKVDPYANPEQLLKINPLGTVPALELDDGSSLCDSKLICEYLDHVPSEQPHIFPLEPAVRFQAVVLGSIADGLMDAGVHCVLESRRPEAQRSESWMTRKEEAIMRTIQSLANQNFSGDRLTVGTLGVVCALDWIRFRMPHLDWQGVHPKLAEWVDQMLHRSSFAATAPIP